MIAFAIQLHVSLFMIDFSISNLRMLCESNNNGLLHWITN